MTWIRVILFPFCWLYGVITWLRNKFFDWGVLPSEEFDVPVISVGNLSTGGTGKTPHVEYLIRLLQEDYHIAVVSRGYKRKTSGLVVATPDSTAADIGDEPLQIARKFPKVLVVVHGKRRKAIRFIREKHPEIDIVLMDDGFQHRYVQPGLNLLLTEYYKPFFQNFVLPCGNLREFKKGSRRANALIVTKTPKVFSPLDRRFFLKKLDRFKLPKIFFSYIQYGDWVPFHDDESLQEKTGFKTVFLFTGIANTSALEEHLKEQCEELHLLRHPDHHQFTESDILKLKKQFRETYSGSKAVVITEKDAMRLQQPELREALKSLPVYYIPIEVAFHDQDRAGFRDLVSRSINKK
jgi:tetraacyldisaccharide 4'-kinase